MLYPTFFPACGMTCPEVSADVCSQRCSLRNLKSNRSLQRKGLRMPWRLRPWFQMVSGVVFLLPMTDPAGAAILMVCHGSHQEIPPLWILGYIYHQYIPSIYSIAYLPSFTINLPSIYHEFTMNLPWIYHQYIPAPWIHHGDVFFFKADSETHQMWKKPAFQVAAERAPVSLTRASACLGVGKLADSRCERSSDARHHPMFFLYHLISSLYIIYNYIYIISYVYIII